MNNIDIDRINELYHKSKSVGLTKAEEAEQKKLRKAYLAAIRKNLRGSLNRIDIQNKDGSIENLGENLRCDMKARRNALTDEEKKHAAANCLSKLKELPEFMNADWIYAYIACRNELETSDIISWCLSYGKHVAVPKVQGEIMHFYEITALSDCVPGAFGILEPAGEEKDRITTPGFMLVPGLAFDKNGNRLGYGGGFYDKYLASHEEIITAALGYDFQIVEKVPSESHDRRMDYLIY